MIGVSAAATADQLAHVAMVAAADGREITGILVADPESTDRTNGRIPRPVPADTPQAVRQARRYSNGDQAVSGSGRTVRHTSV